MQRLKRIVVLAGSLLLAVGVTASSAQSAADIQALRTSAAKGDADAQFNLGFSYATGQGVPQDYAQAEAWWRKAAEQGLASAQHNLGRVYDDGQGVPQDAVQAVTWYRKAAEQGDADAQNNLGVLYVNGHGVPQDYAEAHKWYNLAASRATGARRDTSAKNRDELARTMTPEQIADAQRRAAAWQAAFERRKR